METVRAIASLAFPPLPFFQVHAIPPPVLRWHGGPAEQLASFRQEHLSPAPSHPSVLALPRGAMRPRLDTEAIAWLLDKPRPPLSLDRRLRMRSQGSRKSRRL